MNVLVFFNKSDALKKRIIFMASLSGLANGMLLAIINTAAEQVVNQKAEIRLAVLYLTAFALYVYTQRYALSQATIAVENLIRQVRLRVADKIRHSELRFIEQIGFSNMYEPLSKDTNLIAQTAVVLSMTGQSVIVMFFSSAYLALLSPLSLCITVVFITGSILMYLVHNKEITEELQQASEQEIHFFTIFKHILDGFKEIRINFQKNDAVFQHLRRISEEMIDLKIRSGLRLVTDMMYGQVSFYILLAILVFILPLFSPTYINDIYKITATILFISGPVSQFAGMIPMLAKANIAVVNLYQLEKRLDEALGQHAEEPLTSVIQTFQEIRLEELTFFYRDKNGKPLFGINRADLSVQRGEMLFIVGGNGSGKSTLLKLLVGLYSPEEGDLYVDEERLNSFNYQSYRELFAIIFTDFHLFDRLYGIEDVDADQVNALLRLVELDKKVQYVDGRFTNLDLSTGQKKRLAFVAAVLEDKPIYIFDELAADQDPQFRRSFYEKILPDLQQQGKTIIAVTHDDHYFHVADRILKMEYGQLVEYNEHAV